MDRSIQKIVFEDLLIVRELPVNVRMDLIIEQMDETKIVRKKKLQNMILLHFEISKLSTMISRKQPEGLQMLQL